MCEGAGFSELSSTKQATILEEVKQVYVAHGMKLGKIYPKKASASEETASVAMEAMKQMQSMQRENQQFMREQMQMFRSQQQQSD